MSAPKHFIAFRDDASDIDRPERFTFPFYYTVHPLCQNASAQIHDVIGAMDWDHNFGLDPMDERPAIGKMFGVLVVEDRRGKLGFLAAFSGKVADSNHHHPFVPPVFDMLDDDGFFKKEEAKITAINKALDALLNSDGYMKCKNELQEVQAQAEAELAEFKALIKSGKARRKKQRVAARLHDSDLERLENQLVKESLDDQYRYKRAAKAWKEKIEGLQIALDGFEGKIASLKTERKTRSNALQKRLFESYQFLNARGDTASLLDIFEYTEIGIPPTGAGECAAPKLLHYAFRNGLKPIAMAEFWWGKSNKEEVRKHKQFYPSCRGKCEPILTHMLQGLAVDPNPLIAKLNAEKSIEILYEDAHVLAIHKPADLLSVPGKEFTDSVYTRIRTQYPEAKGPLVVHRLDMSTSGIMLLAKTKDAHKHLQQQFERRKVKKRYTALLEGIPTEKTGEIDLPLRVDFYDRPRQLVCYELGKKARTKWELIRTEGHRSRVHFYPHTGRTHQLRVHAAHALGLNTPIVGDELYGQFGNRLHLHADQITFTHPVLEQEMTLDCAPNF